MSQSLSFKDKVIIILFMGFFVIPMLAIGGLLDLFEVPLRSPKVKIK